MTLSKCRAKELCDQIKQCHERHIYTMVPGPERLWLANREALYAGALLCELKAGVKHGDFGVYVTSHCSITIRQCQRFMRLHEFQDRLDELHPGWMEDLTMVEALDLIAGELHFPDDGDRDDSATSNQAPPERCFEKERKRRGRRVSVKNLVRGASLDIRKLTKAVEETDDFGFIAKAEEQASPLLQEIGELFTACEERRKQLASPVPAHLSQDGMSVMRCIDTTEQPVDAGPIAAPSEPAPLRSGESQAA